MASYRSLFTLITAVSVLGGIFSCSKSSIVTSSNSDYDTTSSTLGAWSRKKDLPSGGRAFAVAFGIGSKGYIGTGLDNNGDVLSDFMQYDTTTDSWSQIASIPKAREKAFAFVIGDKGYVGSGTDGLASVLDDFYEYDPGTNQWTAKATVPSNGRYDAVAFSVVNKGYIAFGVAADNSTLLKDMYAYDPTVDQWSAAVSSPGEKRAGATAFVYKNSAYIIGGINTAGAMCTDFYKFSPTGQWTALSNISNTVRGSFESYFSDVFRSNASSFVVNDTAYLVGGTDVGENDLLSVWSYNFATDTWTKHPKFSGQGFAGGISFNVGNSVFIGAGLIGIQGDPILTSANIYEFFPLNKAN